MQSKLTNVPLHALKPNPYRDLPNYPWIEHKVTALRKSIEDLGLWESIIARKVGDEYQIAFGHHRVEACRRAGLDAARVIVRDLTDEEMVKFMGRENGEDYSTEFLVMLNTWEGAVQYITARSCSTKQGALAIARLLGWTRLLKDGQDTLTAVASACNSAHALINGGYIDRDDLTGLSVSAAREIVERAHSRMEMTDKLAKQHGTPQAEVDASKTAVAAGAKRVAERVREGGHDAPNTRQLRSEVDVESMKAAQRGTVKPTPLFEAFGKTLINTLERMLDSDATAEKLQEIVNAKDLLTMDDDKAVVRNIDFQLEEIGKRADTWRKRVTPTNEKLVPFPALENK